LLFLISSTSVSAQKKYDRHVGLDSTRVFNLVD
jgi:hypothetical protein